MRVLGVDPGTWRTGVGILETQGNRYSLVHAELIRMEDKKQELSGRLLKIFRRLGECIQAYKPDVVALENVFYAKDVTSLVKIGEARACAMLAAADYGIPLKEYLPTRVKQAVTGNGRASKEQMQHMIKTLLGLKALPQADTADALAVAICHVHGAKSASLRGSGSSYCSRQARTVM